MMSEDIQLLKKRARSKRSKSISLIDYAPVRTIPRDLKARVLSPTRRHNPQPLGLRFQPGFHSTAQPYAIWNPNFCNTRARFPDLLSHLELTNFSCNPPPTTSPWEAEREGPPTIHYSLESTSRSSFQDPNLFPRKAKLVRRKLPTRYDNRPDEGLTIGLVPHALPKVPVRLRSNVINTKQGSQDQPNGQETVVTNSALRAIRNESGVRPLSGLLVS